MNILLYDRPRFQRNAGFARMILDKFEQNHLPLELRLAEEWCPEAEDMPLPSAVLMRCVRPELSRRLEEKGVRVLNSSRVSEICNDKWRTFEFFSSLGIPMMPTIQWRPDAQEEKCVPFSFPCVLKSTDGHGGTEVFRINSPQSLRKIKKDPTICAKKWILQPMCAQPGRDVRVYCVGNQIYTAMLRRSTSDFRSNFSLGGSFSPYELDAEEEKIVACVCEALPLDFAGIDIIFDERPVLNEIEDVVGCRMLYSGETHDILDVFLSFFKKSVEGRGV
ncbi:MAG: ATP-grasp domain-containing protein [Planctomycetia bacterium]|nr:ATP-grasp domain-containing protein [Planctomycetia bacterium]